MWPTLGSQRSCLPTATTSERHPSTPPFMSAPRRQKPYVIRSPRRRLAVEVQLENRLENAYNTSLTLQYSRNLHFSSLSVKVMQATRSLPQAEWREPPAPLHPVTQSDPDSLLPAPCRTTPTSRSSARRSPPTATRVTSATRCSAPSQKYVAIEEEEG